MNNLIEVLFTSDSSGSPWTITAWNPHSGSNLMYYKGGGATNPHGVNLIRNEYILSADSSKPLIHIWPLNKQEQIMNTRFVLPGKATCTTMTKDGNYCIAGVGENLYIWQVITGKLLAVASKHYQTVNVVKFLDDDTHFVSGGRDGMVFVWNLTETVNREANSEIVPLYTFSDHTLPVSDIFIGHGGIKGILASVSLDRILNVYNLRNGDGLLNLVFPYALTAVAMNKMETEMYVGSNEGQIYIISIIQPPRMKEYHLEKSDLENSFNGHEGAVSCISLSLDGEHMVSGGADEKVIIWHIPSRQKIRTLPHKGSITNAFYTLTSPGIFQQEANFNLIIGNFQRMIDHQSNCEINEVLITDSTIQEQHIESSKPNQAGSLLTVNDSEIQSLKDEIKRIKAVNRELYQFKLKKILK